MKILVNLIQKLGKKHGKNLGKIIDRQEEPELYNAVWNKIDSKLSIFTNSNFGQINTELEMSNDIAFEGLGIGWIDNIINAIKYGKYAIDFAKYKASNYVTLYKNTVIENLPPLHKTGLFIKEDFRKEEITQEEVKSIIKQMLYSN